MGHDALAQWKNHALTVLMLPLHDVESRWASTKQSVSPNSVDYEGPDRSIRLPMAVEDSVVGANIVEFEKAVVLESERRKVTGEQQVMETRQDLGQTHMALTDDIYKTVGGDIAAASARMGGSMVNTSGAVGRAASTSVASTSSPAKVGGFEIGSTGAAAQGKVKERSWDVETQKLKLANEISDKREALKQRAQSLIEACSKAEPDTSGRAAEVVNQAQYIDIMVHRADMLRIVNKAKPSGPFKWTAASSKESWGKEVGKLSAASLALGKVETPADKPEMELPEEANTCLAEVVDEEYGLNLKQFGWDVEAKKFPKIKVDHLKALMKVFEDAQEAWGAVNICMEDETMKALTAVMASLAGSITKLKEGAGQAKQEQITGELAGKLPSCSDHLGEAKCIFVRFAWDGNAFAMALDLPSLGAMREAMLDAIWRRVVRLELSSDIRLKKAQGRAMPAADVEQMPIMLDFTMLAHAAGTVNSEDQAKRVKQDLASMCSAVERFLKVVSSGQAEVLNNIASHDKKARQAEERERKQEAAEAAKRAKEQQQTKKGSLDGKGKIASAASSSLLDMQHSVFSDLAVYEKETDFTEARQAASYDINGATPVIIKSHSVLVELLSDRAAESAISVFKIQYPTTSQAQCDKRGQTPYNSPSCAKIREALVEMVPKGLATDSSDMVGKLVSAVSLFGCSPGLLYSGTEKHSLPTVRYTVAGSREIAVIAFKDLEGYAKQIGKDFRESKDFFADIAELVGTLADTDSMDALVASGGKVFRSIVGPGSLAYIPFGSWVIERTIGDISVIGVRTAHLSISSVPCESFGALRAAHLAVQGREHALSKFWAKVQAVVDEGVRKASA